MSGSLSDWDRFDDLHQIGVPTLVIGARYDTMDPAHMAEMALRLPNGTYPECPNGSHLAMYDDHAAIYVRRLIDFLTRVGSAGTA